MSSHTSPSDHCNSVARSASVIHSESLLNSLVARSRSKLAVKRNNKHQTWKIIRTFFCVFFENLKNMTFYVFGLLHTLSRTLSYSYRNLVSAWPESGEEAEKRLAENLLDLTCTKVVKRQSRGLQVRLVTWRNRTRSWRSATKMIVDAITMTSNTTDLETVHLTLTIDTRSAHKLS